MTRSERVIHIEIAECSKCVREVCITLLLAFLETQVLKQNDATLRKRGNCAASFFANATRSNTRHAVRRARSKKFAESLCYWLHGVLALESIPFRSTEMRHENCTATTLKHGANRAQTRANAAVVRDRASLHRHVEIHANEHALKCDRNHLDVQLLHGGRSIRSVKGRYAAATLRAACRARRMEFPPHDPRRNRVEFS